MKSYSGSDKKAGDAKGKQPASVVSLTGAESATGGRARKKRKGRSTHSVHRGDGTRPSSSITRPPSSRRQSSHHKKCRSSSHSAPSKSSVHKHVDTSTTSSTSVKRKKSGRKRSVQSAKGKKRSARDEKNSVSTWSPSRDDIVTPNSSQESVLRVEYLTHAHSFEEQEVQTPSRRLGISKH
ncbi:serine/arginine-rich splicing factor 4-like [Branchiostoma lanceolatum]|uniref:serine/arginine-rich splicing factor 4-like n=1 Tax=Branchiostoma lanceolatum TaxID=7740 RepID=UPI0034531C8C